MFSDKDLPSIALPAGLYDEDWGNTKEAFKYIYKNFEGKYDWIMRTEDDT